VDVVVVGGTVVVVVVVVGGTVVVVVVAVGGTVVVVVLVVVGGTVVVVLLVVVDPSAVGVTAFDGAEIGLAPLALIAATLNVYDTPLVRPGKTNEFTSPATVCDAKPGDAVTAYDAIGPGGGVHETDAAPSSAAAVTAVGASGGSS
jgi:hypothetical protein